MGTESIGYPVAEVGVFDTSENIAGAETRDIQNSGAKMSSNFNLGELTLKHCPAINKLTAQCSDGGLVSIYIVAIRADYTYGLQR